ncbi:hypothetical protein V8E36_008525 [Tilletia maclaganii]
MLRIPLVAAVLLVVLLLADMAAPIRHNADGTVDLASIKTHVEHLKGKYAQNAKNYERNTGHKLDFGHKEHKAGEEQGADGTSSTAEASFPPVQVKKQDDDGQKEA